jgi:hypothetical protein
VQAGVAHVVNLPGVGPIFDCLHKGVDVLTRSTLRELDQSVVLRPALGAIYTEGYLVPPTVVPSQLDGPWSINLLQGGCTAAVCGEQQQQHDHDISSSALLHPRPAAAQAAAAARATHGHSPQCSTQQHMAGMMAGSTSQAGSSQRPDFPERDQSNQVGSEIGRRYYPPRPPPLLI